MSGENAVVSGVETEEIHHRGTEGTEGEVCYRVPVALWEKTQARLNELELAQAEVAEKEESRRDAEPQSGSVPEAELLAERDALINRQSDFIAKLTGELEHANAECAQLRKVIHDKGNELSVVILERDALIEEKEESRRVAEPQSRENVRLLVGDLVELQEWPSFQDERLYVGQRGRVIAIGVGDDFGTVKTDIPCKVNPSRSTGETMWWSVDCLRVVERAAAMTAQIPEEERVVAFVPLSRRASVNSDDTDRASALELVLRAVQSEVREAIGKHAQFNSAHEGYAVILEELDELKAEVWKKREERDKAKMQEEAVQVAAMAVRFVLDVI